MQRLKPLLVALGAATALTLVPVSFGALPAITGIGVAQAAPVNVSVDIFFKPLAQHGVWVKHPKYRYVFCPRVDAKWRPYSHGHWVYLDRYGWYFASDEPFAWAVYHYGRWFHEAKLGWCWVPGNAWAGAWVAWRRSNDYVGWAPLPPTKDGFAVNVDVSKQEPPKDEWIFVPPKRFLEPKLSVAVVFGDQHPDAFQRTKYVGPVTVENNIVVNNVININFIQQQTNQKVKVVKPQAVDQPDQAAADANGEQIAVFAPQIQPPKQDEAPPQAVDEDQAAQQLGSSSEQPSSSSEQPSSSASSGEMSSSSSMEASSASSGEPASSASSSMEASSSAAASSASSSIEPASSSSSAETSSSVAPASSSVEASSAPTSSSIEPSSSAAPASSSAPAPAPSSSAEPPASSAAPASSSEAAPASSSEPKAAPSSSEEQAAPSSEAPAPASSAECPAGYIIVKGKCVPAESSAADTTTSEQAPASQQ